MRIPARALSCARESPSGLRRPAAGGPGATQPRQGGCDRRLEAGVKPLQQLQPGGLKGQLEGVQGAEADPSSMEQEPGERHAREGTEQPLLAPPAVGRADADWAVTEQPVPAPSASQRGSRFLSESPSPAPLRLAV